MNMRRLFVSLPWELVGPRSALISLASNASTAAGRAGTSPLRSG